MEPYECLFGAIGKVLQASAIGSIVLHQVSETLSGSLAAFVPLIDEPLGRQVAHVRGLLQAPAVPQDRNLLALGLELVTDLESLLRYRNRIAHDQWVPIGIEEHEDGAYWPPTVGKERASVHL